MNKIEHVLFYSQQLQVIWGFMVFKIKNNLIENNYSFQYIMLILKLISILSVNISVNMFRNVLET